MGKDCACATKCEKHQKPAKDKCQRHYENERKLDAAFNFSLMLGFAGLVSGMVWSLALALISSVGLIVVLFGFRAADRSANAWKYIIHPRNRAEIEQLERSLSFLEKLRRKMHIKHGDSDERSAIIASLEALRHRTIMEFDGEKATSFSIYSDKRSKLNAHLNVLDSILAGMRGPDKLCFSVSSDVHKNYILAKIKYYAYPYLEEMPNV